MILSKETFVKLVNEEKIQIKQPLKRLDWVGFGIMSYQGKENKVWCNVKKTFVNDASYKVDTRALDVYHNGREWYTCDLLDFINKGHIEAKINL